MEQSLKEIAEKFLAWLSKALVYLWGRFFFLQHGRYWEVSPEELSAIVGRFLHSTPQFEEKVSPIFVGNIVENLRAKCLAISMDAELPFWLGPTEISGDVIPMKKGLLQLDIALTHPEQALMDHNRNLFTFVSMPYDFCPTADCPKWLKFLAETFDDPDEINLLQEWFGAHFLPRLDLHRFMLMYGQGANGKSVVCLVLKEMLGDKNVSSVGLDQFNPARTFPLAATIGKLGNVVGELNPATKAAEGMLKQYISRERMTVEEKYKPPFAVKPTALLTFATNELPKFADRSDGIWRRLLLLPFKKQILDGSKQDSRLVTSAFWKEELPGIFRWALEGRERLKLRGYFIEPESSKASKDSFRESMNSAQSFLRLYYVAGNGPKISSSTVYQAYMIFCGTSGQRSLTAAQFADEVRRQFPTAELSKNPVSLGDGTRGRVWNGFVAIKAEADTGSTDGTP